MDIRGLGYIGIDVSDLDGWTEYARLLGAMVVAGDAPNRFRLRIDERSSRVMVRASDSDGLAFAGWELPDAAALDQACRELEEAGFEVTDSSASERAERSVSDMVRTLDPAGIVVELFWGPIDEHRLFVSPAGVSGFVTGEMGMGHVVLGTPVPAESLAFYSTLLGFRMSDYMPAGGHDAVFLRCNPRHHSLALIPGPRSELYHFMIEARTLDDVGFALERHRESHTPISMGLGRHPNDLMVSFYSRSPSGFDVEFGCGGRLVDESTWTVSRITKASLWGHHRPGG